MIADRRIARARPVSIVTFLLVAIIALVPSIMAAQTTIVSFSFTGGGVTFGPPTAADFIAGSRNATGGMPFQITTTGEVVLMTQQTTISIRSSSSTLGSGKPVGDLQWRRSDQSSWNSVTTTNVQVQSWSSPGAEAGHTYTNTLFFRVLLGFTSAKPADYTGQLVFTIVSAGQ
ncbi:MAG TPA: hypothetical protein VM053_02530 [Gemmatimonadaceae bacterium]|nr:hypothetical protein [Gemmatimonadaceae bacterium]